MDMKETILEIAQRLVQQRGVNGFSYADIAKEVGISKPSLHHHFTTKSALITRLIENYTEQLVNYLDSLSKGNLTYSQKLNGYYDLYRNSLNEERICLGGMLSAEALTLGPEIQPLLQVFFKYQQKWLIELLEQGVSSGEFHLATPINTQASVIIATLQGALVVSRATKTSDFFESSIEGLSSFIK